MTDEPTVPGDDAPHLLVVDDDTRIRTLLKQFLTTNGSFTNDFDMARAISGMWKKVGIDAARCGETHPAMHDAVPDRDHFPAFEVIDGPVEQILEEFRMRQAGALCPCALDQDAPINPARD